MKYQRLGAPQGERLTSATRGTLELGRAIKTFKRLISALCERVVLVQVLQLPVPAPLVAGIPAGHKTPDHTLEEVADERLWGTGRGRGGWATKENVTRVLHSTAHHFLSTSTAKRTRVKDGKRGDNKSRTTGRCSYFRERLLCCFL